MSAVDAAELRSAPAPLARAFLALADEPAPPAHPRAARRVRGVAAGVAVVALALAAPLTTAGLALTWTDRHDAATLPGKTWLTGDEDSGGDGAGG
jgi:hypothetical protein